MRETVRPGASPREMLEGPRGHGILWNWHFQKAIISLQVFTRSAWEKSLSFSQGPLSISFALSEGRAEPLSPDGAVAMVWA